MSVQGTKIMGRKDQAYEFIKKAIIENEIPPGAPIREAELAETLHMSRSPIREALRELEAEGVIISYPSRGTIVTPVTVSDVEEIYQLRSMMELWALEQGFHRFTNEEITQLEQAFTEAYQASDWKALHEADIQFHHAIIRKSGSKRLASFIHVLNTQIERIRRYSAKGAARMELSYQEHMAVLNAIRSKDLPQSKRTLKDHLRSVSNSALEAAKMMEMDSFSI